MEVVEKYDADEVVAELDVKIITRFETFCYTRRFTKAEIEYFLKKYVNNKHYYCHEDPEAPLKVPAGKTFWTYYRIFYLEPSIEGMNIERIIVGGDGEIWYTPDHYVHYYKI